MSDSSLLSALRASFVTGTPPITSSVAVDVSEPSSNFDEQDEQLDIFGQILDEIEARRAVDSVVTSVPSGTMAQVVPQVALQVTDTLNPLQTSVTSIKEGAAKSALEIAATADAGGGLQVVEAEKVPELPPEVESFLERVEDHQAQLPPEIVLAGASAQAPATTHHPSQPVIVLPITPVVEKEGEHKSPKFSVRWLVEWSHKIIKMFTGRVIYSEA